MSDEDKLIILEEARENLVSAIDELKHHEKEFSGYIDSIQVSIDELDVEIQELSEKQNKIWQAERNEANREFESMRI